MDTLERTLMTISCRDADRIPKVPDAGRIRQLPGQVVQFMHNGLQVVAGGYHGDWMAHIIRALGGHHEPQEESLFFDLLKYARHNSLFVELGAFWAYYTLWYLKDVPGSRAICIEPDSGNLAIGRKNAALNQMSDRIRFQNAWVGGQSVESQTGYCESTNENVTLPCLNMDDILEMAQGEVIEILHMDVQGAELPFLQSLKIAVSSGRIRFVVVSTHHSSISGSRTTHEDCLHAIKQLGGLVLAEHNVQESFSGDGLIVASFFAQDHKLHFSEISRNEPKNSLFPES
ncbi:FkbM family methyltransferase [Rhizobium tropici]|uniref:Methyltransferase FkbM domain-containing protein n=1 Tax=Rhizobium tropici TaxID=398 RepID=A0A329YCJ2_RHITR|nr:FkbM family methyltransferase [Rhizobium tropici]RAX41989.1 hypothetical protein DQ393_10435 [Rhizobium tropici]